MNTFRPFEIAALIGLMHVAGCGKRESHAHFEQEPPAAVPAASVVPEVVEMAQPLKDPPLEFFGNYETAGVIAEVPPEIPAGELGTMRAYLQKSGNWARVQDPVQVGDYPWFATSLFWLKPGQRYTVRVDVHDRGGRVIKTLHTEGATRREPVLGETANRRYVALDGNDLNPGTDAQPFGTLARALRNVTAGQTIVMRAGTYYEGDLALGRSGFESAPIVIRAYPGEVVVLDGADPAALNATAWHMEADGLYSYPVEGACRSATLVERESGRVVRLFPVARLEHLQKRHIPDHGALAEMGIEGAIFCNGRTAYILPPGPLERYRVHVALRKRAMSVVDHRSVQLHGLTFDHYGKGPNDAALHLENASDILVQQCRFRYDNCPIYVKGDTDRLTVQDCDFQDAILDWPFSYMKGGSGISGYFEGGAVNVDATYSGRGLVFRRNRIANYFDGAHLTPWVFDAARTQETDFYQNQIDGCMDDFVEVDGFSRNVRIFDNVMNRSLTGVSLAQALDGPTYVVYNVIANCGMVPAAQREGNYGYPFKLNGGPQTEIGCGPMFFYHNTAYTQDPNSRALMAKHVRWSSMTMRNNIWVGRMMGFELWPENPPAMDFDFDNLYTSNPNGPLVLQYYHKEYKTLEEVRSGLKWLEHGISADPQLVDAAGGDFSLGSNSPCIDAGIVVAGINEGRMRGMAPDLGAIEAR